MAVCLRALEDLVDDLLGRAEVVARVRARRRGVMLRLSASRASACCLALAAIRPVSTRRPSTSSAVCDAATRVRRESAASAGHSGARRRPAARRPSRRRRGAAGPRGPGRPGRRAGRAPTAPGSASAASSRSRRDRRLAVPPARAISGRAITSTSLATWPMASVARTSASAYRVRAARLVCQGTAFSSDSRRATSATRKRAASTSPASSVTAASVPAAPPICSGKCSARTSSRASSTPCSQLAALSPKVIGTACWVSVRPGITSSRWRSTSATSAVTWRSSWSQHAAGDRRAPTGRRRCPATSWLVSPRCSHCAAGSSAQLACAQVSASSGTTGLPLSSACSQRLIGASRGGQVRLGRRRARCRR